MRKLAPLAIWLVPAAVVGLVLYLGLAAAGRRGPDVTITFPSAAGLGQGTKIEHKAVQLGTVQSVTLSEDGQHAVVQARMTSDAEPYLTDQARFWVVRPQLTGGSVTGLNNLLSGPTVEMDPGRFKGARRTSFEGLTNPPPDRSDLPGVTFELRAPGVAGLASGTRLFFRDVVVGEVLDSHLTSEDGGATARIFVRKPFDARVRTGSVFWQFAGVSSSVTGAGLHVQVDSVQALLSGGIAFNTPPGFDDYPQAPPGTWYPLFPTEAIAIRAAYNQRVPCVAYFSSSAAGLDAGSSVQIDGTRAGEVTGVHLLVDPAGGKPRVRVEFVVLPQRLHILGAPEAPLDTLRRLVAGGLLASLSTTSYVTSTKAIALEIKPVAAAVVPGMENGALVIPSDEGGGGGMMASLPGMLAKAASFPFGTIGSTADTAVSAIAAALKGAAGNQSVGSLVGMLEGLQAKVRSAQASLDPILRELPGMVDSTATKLRSVRQALDSADKSYGSGSSQPAGLLRTMDKYFDLGRYVRLVADYLNRHPESVVRGSYGKGAER